MIMDMKTFRGVDWDGMSDEEIEEQYGLSSDEIWRARMPWVERTLPGRSGSFRGHAAPAACFLGLSVMLLLLALTRARRLLPNQSFAQLHIPERSVRLKMIFGGVGMVLTLLLMFAETSVTHKTLYLLFFAASATACIESQGRLPLDTYRAALVVAFVNMGMMWHHHGTMKTLPVDIHVHILLAYSSFAAAAMMAYSMCFTDSVMAYIGGYVLIGFHGVWLFTVGYYECCMDINEPASLFSVEGTLVMMLVIIVAAYFGPKPHSSTGFSETYEYDPVNNTPGEDENGAEPALSDDPKV